MDEIRYTVTGMSCGHCVASITEEVTQVAGVSDVSVDLRRNEVTVRGNTVDDERVRAAITEAGYAVAGLATP
ncbi:heavy-metal-associated domain-containing protein [Streptomyces violaceusniger]|uniref:Heavy metal transport/detoxification protein n=1 Tax=Streptomyces violaceusniger TaxID=68280 RepID=A0A4D4LJK8_STRVO|nr:heavy metal transport/detoxification protein [Streptomyces violaceusniger]